MNNEQCGLQRGGGEEEENTQPSSDYFDAQTSDRDSFEVFPTSLSSKLSTDDEFLDLDPELSPPDKPMDTTEREDPDSFIYKDKASSKSMESDKSWRAFPHVQIHTNTTVNDNSVYYAGHELHPVAGLVGFVNLGNTCYMNSALQCLTHSMKLTEYFLTHKESEELNTTNPLGMGGQVAESYASLLHQCWPFAEADPRTVGNAFAPREFKSTIGRFTPQFTGYQQHDSQEFLAFLLDGLHEDLNRIKVKPYIPRRDDDDSDDNEKELKEARLEGRLALESWQAHKKRNDSIIVDLCQGLFKSTLVCPHCNKVSVTFDPFMYLSLPLPTVKKSFLIPFVPADINECPKHVNTSIFTF
jgi:ubiquitin C-terminal hydrolase